MIIPTRQFTSRFLWKVWSAIREPNSTGSRFVAFAASGGGPNIISTGSEIADPEEASV
jgi:hypothetical protein